MAIWLRSDPTAADADFSGTKERIAILAQIARPESSTKSVCQSITRNASSTGLVAEIAPIAPTSSIHPIRVASRSSGNHSANTVMEDMKQTATPMPISARPNRRVSIPSATAKTIPPRAATSSIVALTRRGP